MDLYATTLTTPAGPFTVLMDDGGVCAAGFSPQAERLQRRLDPARRAARVQLAADLGAVATALRAYLAGELEALDQVPVRQPGDPRQQAAWQVLRSVPAGRTISYRELGRLAGLADPATDPLGARAAGAACASNHVAVIVPCHRVLRSNGGLGGYGWGLPRKRWLLSHEAALPSLLDQPAPAGGRRVSASAGLASW